MSPDRANPHGLDCAPLPRWTILPRDPPPLVRWLRAKQAEQPWIYGEPLPPEPPPEEDL